MKSKQATITVALLILLAITGYGVYWTGRPVVSTTGAAKPDTSVADSAVVVDQSSLITAEQLVRLPTAAEERTLAEDALRISDQEMDLAFASAVRRATAHPRAVTAEVKEIDARVEQSERALIADSVQAAALTAAMTQARGPRRDTLSDRLELVKAQTSLDEDESDDARQDLIRAGGDPQGRMQAMVAEHDASSKSADSARVVVKPMATSKGMVDEVQVWTALRRKELEIAQAKAAADSSALAFAKKHDLLGATYERRSGSADQLSHTESAALIDSTKRRAANEKARSALDQRVDNQHKLSDIYASWRLVVRGQERAASNRVLRAVVMILIIALFGLLFDRWIEGLLSTISIDRRQTQTLCMVARVSLQVLCVLLVLLVIFGAPNNLGTFLGLAGAGLTVALKDFILGFAGWFVLMGKNGIRIGDLVEINSVTGEVVELGMFHTTLIETGSWTDSEHPTGRHVSFTNGFAIEGHYFNFSTSGQWLWDELRITVPAGRDPFAMIDALKRQLEESTADSAQQAEQQWRGARRWPQVSALKAEPSLNIKPVSGGVEIIIRYITRVAERSQVRAKLYETAVELLGTKRDALVGAGPTAEASKQPAVV